MRSGEEIQAALRKFVARWQDYRGTEKSEAQTFLNQLFDCYGTDRREAGAVFESFISTAGFLDLLWPEICIVEMKAPARALEVARAQVKNYWEQSSRPEDGLRAARFVLISNFQEFELWEPGRYPTQAVARFPLADLPDKYDVLAFFAGPHVEPNFIEHYREMTKEAAGRVADVFHSLDDRQAAVPTELQRFVLQAVWCMFAEDLGLLDGFPFQGTLNACRNDPDRSLAELSLLFRVLNQKTNTNRQGLLAGTRFVNGELFAQPAEVRLNRHEIDLLLQASAFDWRKVDPTIFGSLMEGVLGRTRRWQLGAHYTHEVDIMKIVGPTLIRPWRDRIEATRTPSEAKALLEELCGFRVLDPACGCGNFLYVAYRELRGLEHDLKQRIQALAESTGFPVPEGPLPFYALRNLQGIDLERSAVGIAKVTLWMGQRQMIDRYGEAEPPLPLQDLSTIRQGDALRIPWPETDCIVGNPPFQGASHLRRALGDEYVGWLRREFGVGVKDLCTYWFRKAADHLKPGQRAGLVGTNSISQNLGRSASLEYVESQGGVITDAVSSQKWPGEAKVHVSIVNWVDEPVRPPSAFVLDGIDVMGITTSLRAGVTTWVPRRLAANRLRCFEGPSPKAKGFLIADDVAERLLGDQKVDYSPVVRRYLTAENIADDPLQLPGRWVIDFGLMSLETASRFPEALEVVRNEVLPIREGPTQKEYLGRWWQFARPRPGMRVAFTPLSRYVAMARHGKRAIYAWSSTRVLPSDATKVFAFGDDYSMGILLSIAHASWAWERSGTFKADLRYTSSSTFETFPLPDPVSIVHREAVAEASRRLLARRAEICTTDQIGLTKLYNAVDEGAWTDLKDLHRELDEAVADCYGWRRSVAQEDAELVRLLNERNREIVEGGRAYDPFG